VGALRPWSAAAACVLTLLAATTGQTQDTGEVAGYCQWLMGAADANRALLVSPEVFLRGALVQSAAEEQEGDGLALDPSLRVTAGARYRFGGLHRASALRAEAEAMCARYRAEASLREFSDLDDRLGLVQALGAELQILDRALEDAQTMLERVRVEVEEGTATAAQEHASSLRVERLRERRRGAKLKLAELEGLPRAPSPSEFPALLSAWRDADGDAEDARAAARMSRAWDASLSLGYDEILGVERALPLVASAQLSLNLGVLMQPAANDRAAAGLVKWREEGPNPAKKRIDRTVETLSRIRTVEADRLKDVLVLLADVRERRGTLEGIDSSAARRHREALWFTEMDLAADAAFLRARIAEIDTFLARADAPGVPRLRMTLGEVQPLPSSRFRVAEAKTRGVMDHSDGRAARLQFIYHGPSRDTAALGSGKLVRQIGVKLLAQDGCNLLYVMWRQAPKPSLYVASKTNPGKTRHKECGTDGYVALVPTSSAPIKSFDDGRGHSIDARVVGQTLTVRIDDAVVWEGPVAAQTLALAGPAGFRTDNGEFEFKLETP
jgi:hypothetical protein